MTATAGGSTDRHEAPSGAGVLPLEAEAMRQIVLHAMASVSGRCYPSLLTTRRSLWRAWRQDHARGTLREGAVDLISEFVRVDCSPPTGQDIDEFSSRCLAQLDVQGLCILRTYVSLTEAYNFLATGSFLTRREWLCPWQRWNMYLYAPLWEDEVAFVRLVGALGRMQLECVYEVLVTSPAAYVGETVVETAAGIADGMSQVPDPDSPDAAAWLGSLSTRMGHDYSLETHQADLAAVLQYYIISGRLLLARRWWGYQVAAPVASQ